MTDKLQQTIILLSLIAASVICRFQKFDGTVFDLAITGVVGGIFGASVPGQPRIQPESPRIQFREATSDEVV